MRRPVTFADDHLFEPLDGGWGWVVVFGSGVLGLTNTSMASVFGLLFGGALKAMGHETTAAALIANIMLAVTSLAGLLIGPAVRYFDYRRVAIAGTLLASAGTSLTFLTTRAWHMVITYSLLFGLGYGLQIAVKFLAVNTYWKRWLGRAHGLAMACHNVGHILLPHLVAHLLETYGFRGAMLLLGPICLQALPAVLLWQPLGWHSKRKVQTKGEELQCLRTPAVEQSADNEKAADKVSAQDDESPQSGTSRSGHPCWNVRRQLTAFFDLDLLSSVHFCVRAAGLAAVYAMNLNFTVLLPLYLQRAAGLSLKQTALCLSARGIGDVVCRLTIPSLTDKLRIRSRWVVMVGALTSSTIRIILTLVSGQPWILTLIVMEGFARSAFAVNYYICMVDDVPSKKNAATVGLISFLVGITTLVLGPIIGHIRDSTGDYALCVRLIAILVFLAMAAWLLEYSVTAARRRRRTPPSE